MDPEEMALRLQHLEVAAHGHVRDVQGMHELGDSDRTLSAEPIQDVSLSLWC